MQYAPIALFTYNRADHTKAAVESLLKNEEARDSDLIVFSDGAKNEKTEAGVNENREYIRRIKGFKSVTIIERSKNWGLANSLIAGITEVINKYGRVIVVEDDLILSPYFLKFMNDGLEKYKDEDEVGAISGFLPPIKEHCDTTFFLTYFDCWGWATWKRSWDLLILDSRYLLRKLRFKKTKYDMYDGKYGTLYCQKVGLVDSWYVRYYASLFLAKKLILFPPRPLVTNEGLDGTGTHCSGMKDVSSHVDLIWRNPILLQNIEIEENKKMTAIIQDFFKSRHGKNTFLDKVKLLKGFIRRLLYLDCL